MTARWWSPPSGTWPTLTAIERSANTVRAYAISLKLWFEFLAHASVSWDEAGVEDVARFVAWLRPRRAT